MSPNRLKLYCPPEESTEPTLRIVDESMVEPDILPFDRSRRTIVLSGRFTPAPDRARVIHENRLCPECGGSDVEPLELADSLVSPRSRLPVPGTATLVGFHCNQCQMEWPVYEVTRRNG